MFSTVADKLAIDVEQIENFMLEGDQVSNYSHTPLFVYVWGRSGSARVDIINYTLVYSRVSWFTVCCVTVGDDREFL